jgi:hypothetical protein
LPSNHPLTLNTEILMDLELKTGCNLSLNKKTNVRFNNINNIKNDYINLKGDINKLEKALKLVM